MLRSQVITRVWVLLIMFMAASPVLAEPRIEYVIDLSRAQTQTATVTMTIRGWDAPALEVHLPAWRPGKYAILDTAGTIRKLEADAGNGLPLHVEKYAKASWRIRTAGADVIHVRYELYANSLGDRTRHIDDTHAFLSGAAVFLYVNERRSEPAHVRFEGRPEWRVTSGLESDPDSPGTLVAPDYDTLVDSPIEVGTHTLHSFEADGLAYELAVWGNVGDREDDLLRDIARIAHENVAVFGGAPYTRYVFILHVAPGIGGGTEHYNSTIVQCRPTTLESEKSYRGLLSLLCHELFHTWNVKQFRPRGIKPYDYTRENYTDLLWVAEGTTSYYDNLLLVRAGLMTPAQYLDEIAALIETEATRPGADVQSVADSSFDAWIKFNRPTPDSINSTVSFYDKGALVSLLLDAQIRETTDGQKSLDTLMAELYKRFPHSERGYDTADLLTCLRDITGQDFSEYFERYISGTQLLPIEELLAHFGLEVVRDVAEDSPEAEAYVGIRLKDVDGQAVVSAVLSDGPAYEAGLIADDQVVAMNGRRLRADELDARVAKLDPGEPITLTILRRDELREVVFTPTVRHAGDWVVRRVEDPTDAQVAAYENWLRVKWPSRRTTPAAAEAVDQE